MHPELVHRELPSPNWDERALPVTMAVIHYTEMDREAALERLTDPDAKVSAHYFISEAGEVIRLVDEDKRAWHAGASYWRGHKDVNSASIGIELDNPGHALGYREFPEAHAAFAERPDSAGYLNGESYRDVDARAFPVIEWLLERHRGERIAVVTHNVVNRVILAKLLGLELRQAQTLRQANCCDERHRPTT